MARIYATSHRLKCIFCLGLTGRNTHEHHFGISVDVIERRLANLKTIASRNPQIITPVIE